MKIHELGITFYIFITMAPKCICTSLSIFNNVTKKKKICICMNFQERVNGITLNNQFRIEC
jgi:hypothetical protein